MIIGKFNFPPDAKCENCKFWKCSDEYSHELAISNVCTAAVFLPEATEWIESEEDGAPDRRMKPEFANSLSFVTDASGYHADLLTRAEFFCNQWNEK